MPRVQVLYTQSEQPSPTPSLYVVVSTAEHRALVVSPARIRMGSRKKMLSAVKAYLKIHVRMRRWADEERDCLTRSTAQT